MSQLHSHTGTLRPIKRIRYTGGTTLIEMLLYLGIVSVLLVGVGTVSMSALDARSKSRAVSAVYFGGAKAMSSIQDTLEQHTVIRAPQIGVASSTLTLAKTVGSVEETEVFHLGTQLFLREQTGELFPLTPADITIDSATFTPLGAAGTTTASTVTLVISASSASMWKSFHYMESFTSTYVLGTYQ